MHTQTLFNTKKKVDSLISHTHRHKTKIYQCCHTKPKANKRVWLTTTTTISATMAAAQLLCCCQKQQQRNITVIKTFTHTYIRICIVYVHTFTLFFSFFFAFRRGSCFVNVSVGETEGERGEE